MDTVKLTFEFVTSDEAMQFLTHCKTYEAADGDPATWVEEDVTPAKKKAARKATKTKTKSAKTKTTKPKSDTTQKANASIVEQFKKQQEELAGGSEDAPVQTYTREDAIKYATELLKTPKGQETLAMIVKRFGVTKVSLLEDDQIDRFVADIKVELNEAGVEAPGKEEEPESLI